MRIRFLAAALAALSGLAASAGDVQWYASIGGGASWADVSGTAVATPPGGILSLSGNAGPDTSGDASWAVFASAGTAIADHLRLEVELGSRSSTLGNLSDISNTTLMLNALFDIPVAESVSVAIGGGAGIDWIATERQIPLLFFDAPDNASTFAYQAIAELSVGLSDHVDLTFAYRYLDTSSTDDLYADVAYIGGVPGGTAVMRVDDLSASTVTVGLRFAL